MANPVQDSFLWTTSSSGDGSATYTQDDWSNICRIISATSGSQGIAPNFMNCYSAACETGTIIVNTGAALVDGKPHHCTTAGSVAIPAATGGNTRIDRITLRAMWNAGDASPATVRIYRLAGTDSGAPTAPALVQTSGSTWDVPLYKVTINDASAITAMVDERYYSSCALAGSGLHVGACGVMTIAPSAISNDKVLNNAISSCLIAASSIYASKIKTNAIVEDTITASAITACKIKAGEIDTVHLASDSVDTAKAGGGIVCFTRRQGGNSACMDVTGTSDYTVSSSPMRMEMGAGSTTGTGFTVTFPTAFSTKPLIFLTPRHAACSITIQLDANWSSAQFSVATYNGAGVPTAACFNWLAIGPE